MLHFCYVVFAVVVEVLAFVVLVLLFSHHHHHPRPPRPRPRLLRRPRLVSLLMFLAIAFLDNIAITSPAQYFFRAFWVQDLQKGLQRFR